MAVPGSISRGQITRMSSFKTFADHWIIIGTSRLLGRDIHIVNGHRDTSREGSTRTLIIPSGEMTTDPIIVGYLPDAKHYVSVGEC